MLLRPDTEGLPRMCPTCRWPWEFGDSVDIFAYRHLRHLQRSILISRPRWVLLDKSKNFHRYVITVYEPRRNTPKLSIWFDVDRAVAAQAGLVAHDIATPYLRRAAAVALAQILLEDNSK